MASTLALLLSLLGSGCAHSILIARNEPKLLHSLARIERAERVVDQTRAPEYDKRLFMMAESFYRYRFEAPEPKLKSYLAQAAAVVSELPAFQELSSAIDINYLRVKSYDGAAQLWETLLASEPTSPLAALALYRLGWAYRSTTVAGLPQDSQRAFADVARLAPGSELARLSREAEQTPWKSQDAVTAYSLFPGLPQLYVGHYREGAIRLSVGVASLAAVVVTTVLAIERTNFSFKRDWPLLLGGALGFVVLTIDYTGSYQSGVHGVVEYNEQVEARFERDHPEAP